MVRCAWLLGLVAAAASLIACGDPVVQFGGGGAGGGTPNPQGGADPGCLAQGACTTPDECCSASCEAGQCAPSCLGAGMLCDFGSSCCSGSCDGSVCAAPTCSADGLVCGAPGDCCSGACNQGICGPPVACQAEGTACQMAAQCCSGSCPAGTCEAGGPCLNLGQPCTTGAQCCIGACDHGLCGSSNCAHDACVQGAALNSGCSPCVMAICGADSFCCTMSWDDQCVLKVAQYCGQGC